MVTLQDFIHRLKSKNYLVQDNEQYTTVQESTAQQLSFEGSLVKISFTNHLVVIIKTTTGKYHSIDHLIVTCDLIIDSGIGFKTVFVFLIRSSIPSELRGHFTSGLSDKRKGVHCRKLVYECTADSCSV